MKNNELARFWLTLGYSFVSIVILINYLKPPDTTYSFFTSLKNTLQTSKSKDSKQHSLNQAQNYSYSGKQSSNITSNIQTKHIDLQPSIEELKKQLEQQKEINNYLKKFIIELQNSVHNSFSNKNNFSNINDIYLQNLFSKTDNNHEFKSHYYQTSKFNEAYLLPSLTLDINEFFKPKNPPISARNPFMSKKFSFHNSLSIACPNILPSNINILQNNNLISPYLLSFKNSKQQNK